jgi:hypothetical protein
MIWPAIAAGLASAAAGVYGSQQAGDAQAKGSKEALALQREQYNTGLTMLEPTRALGYGALSDIGNLYGYKVPEYTPLNRLGAAQAGGPSGSSNWVTGSPIDIAGKRGKEGRIAGIDVNPFSNSRARLGGTIDPVSGEVLIDHKKTAKQTKLSDLATSYLRGDIDELKGRKLKRVRSAIDAMRDQGYEWTDAPPEQQAGPIAGNHAMPTPGTSADGTAGNMSRFFASPDYEFRRSESLRGLERSAAARGGALGGNALRATTELGGNLAAGEYGNYFNRLMSIAGLGQTATTQANAAGQTYANNAGSLQQNIGDSRASGFIGSSNALMGGMNAGTNLWMLQRLLGGG